MRRASVIILVLMGGGAAIALSRPSSECRAARARNAPDVATICGHGGSSYTYTSHGFSSSSTKSSTGSVASVSRGGFGGAGAARAGG